MKNKLELAYDIRVVDRYINEGKISKKEHEEYLKNLPDVSDKGCPFIIDEEPIEEQSENSIDDEGKDSQ